MYSFFFREPQLTTVLHLIYNFYTSLDKRFISLKLGVGIFIFNYVSFLLQFTFFSNKSMNYLTLKRQNSFQNNNNRKATHSFPPDLWFLRCNKKFKNSMISAWDRALQNWHGDEFFKLQTSTFPVCHFFSILTFK